MSPTSYLAALPRDGGWGWIRTNVGASQRFYRPPPLATRAPIHMILFNYNGAGDGTRTRNLLITNQLLCQLSYASGVLSMLKHITTSDRIVQAFEINSFLVWFRLFWRALKDPFGVPCLRVAYATRHHSPF